MHQCLFCPPISTFLAAIKAAIAVKVAAVEAALALTLEADIAVEAVRAIQAAGAIQELKPTHYNVFSSWDGKTVEVHHYYSSTELLEMILLLPC